MWRRCGLAAIAVFGLSGSATANPADGKTFRDWLVVCDNLRNCTAFGLGQDPTGAIIRISRGGARQAPPIVTILADMQKGQTVTLAFDDPALPGLPRGPQAATENNGETARLEISDPAAVDTLVQSLRKANTLVVRRAGAAGPDARWPEESTAPLSGAVAALLYMDEQQQRLGTSTALIRRGPKSPDAIPAPPAMPTISVPRPGTAKIPDRPPAAVLARSGKLCGDDGGEVAHADTYRLSGNLLLYAFTCKELSGPYNYHSAFLVAPADQPQAARRPLLKAPAGFGADTSAETLVNAEFIQDTLTLTTFNKGRGLGDCGMSVEWVWNGREFVLSAYRTMPRCAGVPPDDWPVLYQAARK
jgi:hypothetical protein